jgi:hypothetical protein
MTDETRRQWLVLLNSVAEAFNRISKNFNYGASGAVVWYLEPRNWW